ncbi:hypothetical protein [Chitinilyticum litopenaei]|uniref:hypothetical protein n=1 Tax=Chitinilyticum litopenaei TaxID=1121276 RepID=UPI00041D3E2F|nr:hypothetical protein [Chitinilyticum litopenaei]
MHILSSQLTLAGEHQLERSVSSTQTLQTASDPFAAFLQQRLQAMTAPAPASSPPGATTADSEAARRRCFQSLIALLFGDRTPCGCADAASPAGQTKSAPAAPAQLAQGLAGLRLETTTTISEKESCSFSASGAVCLADGSRREFDLDYAFSRERSYTSTTRASLGPLQDPLVLDLGPAGSALAEQSREFDLDADGKTERVHLPTGYAAVLFLDGNGNGRADDGSELFGPRTGNGFAELAQLDRDGNGWIDEADPDFARLKLWQAGSEKVQTLREAGVGALAVDHAATPFALYGDGELRGQQRASSVWLGENGGVGSVRQVDLAVKKEDKG